MLTPSTITLVTEPGLSTEHIQRPPASNAKLPTPAPRTTKGSAFWLSFTAVLVCSFLSALDFSVVSTALPTIVAELGGSEDFVWVGAAYNLAAATILPFTGQLADILGRRPIMLAEVALFFLGSALAGAAKTMDWLIAARTVQGIGAGGIVGLSSIILSDLVPLSERGIYQALLTLVWAFAAAIGPLIGGTFAEEVTWRWIFYINLPLAGSALVLVAIFLRVQTPPGSLSEKVRRIDFVGNIIIISGTTLALLALTWGGIRYPWSDAHVLAPLVIGFILIATFFPFEYLLSQKRIPLLNRTEPTLPLDILSNRTSLSGYIATFFHGTISISIIYYFPVFFQACQGASPIRSSTKFFAFTFVCPALAIVTGAVVQATRRYRPANFVGWAFIIVGMGLFTLFRADASPAQWIGFMVIEAIGIGIIWVATVFPILAPIPVTRAAPAVAFWSFSRTFAQTWGVTISANILQTSLKSRLPTAFVSQFPAGAELAFAAVPLVHTLPEPLQTEVRDAFAESIVRVWWAMLGFAGAGALSLALLRELPMQQHKDDTYGLARAETVDTLVGRSEAKAMPV